MLPNGEHDSSIYQIHLSKVEDFISRRRIAPCPQKSLVLENGSHHSNRKKEKNWFSTPAFSQWSAEHGIQRLEKEILKSRITWGFSTELVWPLNSDQFPLPSTHFQKQQCWPTFTQQLQLSWASQRKELACDLSGIRCNFFLSPKRPRIMICFKKLN